MPTIDSPRRQILKGSAAASALGIFGIIQWLTLPLARADWPEAAFRAETMNDLMKVLFSENAEDTADIILKVSAIAENGAVVPIGVTTSIDNVSNISIVVPGNPAPLIASYDLGKAALPDISTRMKMGETSDVFAFVQTTDNKLFSTRKEVTVTVGGCG